MLSQDPSQQVPEHPQGLLSRHKSQKAETFQTLTLGLLELWTRPGCRGSRRMGVLSWQLSEPLGPPARLVPRGLASGHGAPLGGATAAAAEPARFEQPLGVPWVCTVCVVVGEAVVLVGFWGLPPWSIRGGSPQPEGNLTPYQASVGESERWAQQAPLNFSILPQALLSSLQPTVLCSGP